jgi:hypothetical protein
LEQVGSRSFESLIVFKFAEVQSGGINRIGEQKNTSNNRWKEMADINKKSF